MEFICNKNKVDGFNSIDLIEFNFLIKSVELVETIEVNVNDNNLQINFLNGSILKNNIKIVDEVSDELLPLTPKFFRRKTFVIGPHHDKVTEKYFFGYIASDNSEKYVTFDGINFDVVDKR